MMLEFNAYHSYNVGALDRIIMEHDLKIKVRYSEVDRMGVVHHSRFFEYLEMGRTEALRALGVSYKEIEAKGKFLVVVKASCRFRAPARYDDELIIRTKVEKVTLTRIDHSYKIFRNNGSEVLAEAETTLACVDGSGNVQQIPQEILNLIKPA